ncbi:MAG: hypothetical protein ACPLZH_01695 [Minisyncoccales bacterium]
MKIVRANSCFEMTLLTGKKESVRLLLGSFEGKEKLVERLKPDIILETKTDYFLKTKPEESFLISEAGEYEIKKIFVWAFTFFKEKERKNFFVVDGEKFVLCCFDTPFDLGVFKNELEEIGPIDTLFFFPQDFSFSSKEVKKIFSDLGARTMIVSNFSEPKKMEDLLRELAIKKIDRSNKISLKKNDAHLAGKSLFILE